MPLTKQQIEQQYEDFARQGFSDVRPGEPVPIPDDDIEAAQEAFNQGFKETPVVSA